MHVIFRVTMGLAVCCLPAAFATSLAAEVLPPASERFADSTTDEVPDFQRHVAPLIGRLGCNGRSCHGSFQGRGGLRLSLFGYDFQMDHEALTARGVGEERVRVDRRLPERSLILRKPALQVDHEGGQRFAVGGWQYQLLRRWIEAGAPDVKTPRKLDRLVVEPPEIVFQDSDEAVALRVTAVWANGDREDVTPLCRFRANNDAIVRVAEDGRLHSVAPGDTHVVVFYDNGVSAVPVMRPYGRPSEERGGAGDRASGSPLPAGESPIDTLVAAKLRKLGIVPSPPCSDAEFLRRASLDLTGTLPLPDEVEAFLADPSADKRERKVDELLERPAFAAHWANRICDYTGCNPTQQAELGQETSVQWYMWVFQRLRENEPYDRLVRRIVLAKSREEGESYDEYARRNSSYFRQDSPADFTRRETMPHYWTRRNMREPEEAAQAFAHNFLGLRLQCAQCHKHPFAPAFDQSFAAMLDRLEESGRLDTTSILVTGEFGRTPKVNGRAGRDHWARAMCALLAGGSVRGGQVLGATDSKATAPLADGYSPDDLAATFLTNIGIDPHKEYEANVGRPITAIRDGRVIPSALGSRTGNG